LRSILRHHLGGDYRETRKDENNGSMTLSPKTLKNYQK